MASGRLLVVEDRASLRGMLRRALEEEGYEVATVADGPAAVEALGEATVDLVLTDLKLPTGSGLDVLDASRVHQPRAPVVVMTAYGTVGSAVDAMKRGATDFLEKPVQLDDLLQVVAALLGEEPRGDGEYLRTSEGTVIVGSHPRLRAALRHLRKVAPRETTVLLTGESGTGKELFARALHELSPRASRPFVAVNCAAIPESLMESELFGHEKGAFTGAGKMHRGRFERVDGGTIFLDEIGDLGPPLQSKVLRVIEERTYERLGGETPRRADFRLVAATNRDLRALVRAGEFRSDLLYRLEVFPLHLPPLRARASDVPRLARHFLHRLAQREGRPTPTLDASAEAYLTERPWPGNVRQLLNLLERATILHDAPRLTASQLRALDSGTEPDEGREVEEALRRAGGDKERAAELLGISYRTLARRIRQYDLKGFPRYR